MSGKWACASIRISSKDKTCTEVTKILGIDPTSFHAKGSLIYKKSSTYRKESLWILDSGISDDNKLEMHVDKLVVLIRGKKAAFKRLLRLKCEVELFLGFSSENGQGSYRLSSFNIGVLSEVRGISVLFDLYP